MTLLKGTNVKDSTQHIALFFQLMIFFTFYKCSCGSQFKFRGVYYTDGQVTMLF